MRHRYEVLNISQLINNGIEEKKRTYIYQIIYFQSKSTHCVAHAAAKIKVMVIIRYSKVFRVNEYMNKS